MRVRDIMTAPAHACRVTDSANEAARQMWDFNCGALPVVQEEGRVVGILTDRDLCMAAYTQGRSLDRISVESAMAKRVYCCRADDTVGDALAVMRDHEVRRLPVVDEDARLIGILSLDDLALETSGARPRRIGVSVKDVGAALAVHSRRRTQHALAMS